MSARLLVDLVFAAATLVALIFVLGGALLSRRPRPVASGRFIVLVEPSVFRAGDARVSGPFATREDAKREARWQTMVNPHAEATVVPVDTQVWRGGCKVWPPEEQAETAETWRTR